MRMLVEEDLISFAVKYSITSDKLTLSAEKKLFSFQPNISVRDVSQDVVATIHGESLLENKFVITLADGRSYHYSRESARKGVELCEGEGDHFDCTNTRESVTRFFSRTRKWRRFRAKRS